MTDLSQDEAPPTPLARARACRDAAFDFYWNKQFLPCGFATALVVGLAWPLPGRFLGDLELVGWSVMPSLMVVLIFIISGLKLKSDDVAAVLRARAAIGWGLLAILVVSPVLSVLPLRLTFVARELRIGLTVFCTMPTTLSSGVALVSQGGGNAALALLLTVLTNLIAVFSVPFVLGLVLDAADVTLSPLPMLAKLVCLILAPLIVGKVGRERSAKFAAFGARRKAEVNRANSVALMAIVWFKVSQSAKHIRSIAPPQAAYVVMLGCALHCALLALNTGALAALALPKEEYRAVLLMASQKTLPMAVTVISLFPTSVGQQGLIVIPCIISHLSQLFIDAAIVSRWLNQDAAADADDKAGGGPDAEAEAAALADSEAKLGGELELAIPAPAEPSEA